MNTRFRLALMAVALTLVAPSGFSQQQASGAAAHWEGSYVQDDIEVPVALDLSRNSQGKWIGTITTPTTRDLPLTSISVDGPAIRFSYPGIGATRTFDGKIKNGSTLVGDYVPTGKPTILVLRRKGEPNIKLPAPSTALGKEFAGTWKGFIDTATGKTTLVLKLVRGADGTAAGTLTAVEQGNHDIPITTITQKGKQLDLELRLIGGLFNGALSASGAEISGKWAQRGTPIPLVFKRQAK